MLYVQDCGINEHMYYIIHVYFQPKNMIQKIW